MRRTSTSSVIRRAAPLLAAVLVVLGFAGQEVRPLELVLPGAHVYDPLLTVDRDGAWVVEARVHDGSERSAVWRRPDKQGFGSPAFGPTLAREPEESRLELAGGARWEARSYLAGSYADGDYEIAVRGPGGETQRVGGAGADFAPTLLACGTRVALVWTNSYFPTRTKEGLVTVGYDRWSDKVYRVAWLAEDGRFGDPLELRLTANAPNGTTVGDRAFPVAGERDGEVFVVYGQTTPSRAVGSSHRLMLCRVDPAGASAPVALDEGFLGPVESLGVARTQNRLLLARTVHEGPGGVAPEKAFVRVLALPLAALPAKRPLVPAPAEPRRDPPPAGLDLADDGRAERPSSDLGGVSRRAWFGNLHMHSNVSRDGGGYEGSPEMNFRAARELAGLDFAMLSDHAEMLCFTEWFDLERASERWNEPGRFVTLFGYEWTSARHGHKNVVAADLELLGTPLGAFGGGPLARTPEELFAALAERGALAIPHHPSHGLGQPTDWSHRDDAVQRLVEIFQVRGNYEYDGAPYQTQKDEAQYFAGHSVRDALALGHRLGIVASPDHGGGLGLAGVWSAELTRAAVFEALHARRTFGTTGAKMSLALEVAGAFQGAELELAPRSAVAVRGAVSGTADGLELTLVVDGQEQAPRRFEGRSAEAEWRFEFSGDDVSYCYLRARQDDGHIGWSSPVWLLPRR